MNPFLALAFALATLPVRPAHAAAAGTPRKPPAWLTLAPGKQAYLKDDGRGTAGTTVCPSPQAYFTFENGGLEQPCRILPHGMLVRVVRIAGENTQDGTITPIVEIGTLYGSIGVTDATFLRPLVPVGTILVARSFGDYPAQMWPEYWAGKDDDDSGYGQNVSLLGTTPVWTALADGTRVQVLQQIPYERSADLKIRVLTGPKRGTTGWSFDLFVPHTNLLNDQFVFAVKAAA